MAGAEDLLPRCLSQMRHNSTPGLYILLSHHASAFGDWSAMCAQLAEALKGDDSLTSLDVNGNNIGPEGITVLANALKGHQNLRTLELGYNPIQSNGAKALVDIFKFDLQVGCRALCQHLNMSSWAHACSHRA